MNAYVEELHKQDQVCTSDKKLCVILDTKYEKTDLNKLAKNKFQNLTEMQRNEFLKLLQKFEELLDGTLGPWKKYPVDIKLKEDAI